MAAIALGLVAVLLALLAVVLVFRRPAPLDPQAMAALRNDFNVLRESTDRSVSHVVDVFSKQLEGMGDNVQRALGAVNSNVAERLEAMNRQLAERLNDNVKAMSGTSKEVNDRMAHVQNLFSELQKQVGGMSEQARHLAELSKSIADLQHVLTAPKLRGGFGEEQLETLLAMVFAREQYRIQYAFSSGDRADALLLFPQGMVAIDSKFSLENFRRMAEAETDADKKAARREFLKDLRRRVDEIASKYIRPDEGTLPFALMYIPAENVYYEAIIRDEDENGLYEYCVQKRVMPVSPNSLYAYLQTIVVGLKSLHVSQQAESILRQMESLRFELEKFTDVYDKLGTHLKNAGKSYEDSTRALSKLENRVQNLAGAGISQPELPLDGEKRLAAAEG
ncbi:MAG TPA: DNA recombination protein RmuC [Terriglobales bacterium]|jgi:DNA recombination protein RmuC|nr:DNA recombination protein RmuC [Terriglobales bacterium]